MPEPVRVDQKYLPGLDGLRALAVAAVIAYHLGYGWAQGGLLGVGVFFTLSGYLITGILLGHWEKAGRLGLREFWLRRARRLLPALFVMLAAVAIWVNADARTYLPGLRGDVIASALYVSNWWYIGQHASYYAQFSPPAPLDHLWSLAVEEQFYLIWPWLLLAAVWLICRGRRTARGRLAARGTRGALAGATILLAAASAVAMAMLYHPGYDPTRAYEGTDTRAFGLLAGAALAMVWPARRARPRPGSAVTLDLAGAAGLAGIAVLVWRTTEYTSFMFRGGLVLLSMATVAVVAAAATPGSVTGRVLGCGPLRWLGVRSYGIYLWHYPIIVLAAPPFGAAFGLPRATAVVAATVATAAVSWAIVEEPVRRGRLPRLVWPRVPWPRRVAWSRSRLVPALAGVACLAVLAATTAVTVTRQVAHDKNATATARLRPTGPAAGQARAARTADPGGPATRATPVTPATRTPPAAPAGPRTTAAERTSCRSVIHIGDSTSEGLNSPDYLPDPAQRITARYAAVGAVHQNMQISGGRSIVERLPGQQNAYTVAKRIIAGGYRGCWVLALGTDDTADVAAGSTVGLAERIRRMMSVIGNQPVLWVNVKSLLSSGPYSERNMLTWNRALETAQRRYPNMRIYDWAAVVRDSWFIRDGIHYTSNGYRHRAQMIADALASAFPAASSPPTAASPAPTADPPPTMAARPLPGGHGRSLQAAGRGDRRRGGLTGTRLRDPRALEVRHVDVGRRRGAGRAVQRRQVRRPLLVERQDRGELSLQVSRGVTGHITRRQRGKADQAAAAHAGRLRVALRLLVDVSGDAGRRDIAVAVADEKRDDWRDVGREQAGRLRAGYCARGGLHGLGGLRVPHLRGGLRRRGRPGGVAAGPPRGVRVGRGSRDAADIEGGEVHGHRRFRDQLGGEVRRA